MSIPILSNLDMKLKRIQNLGEPQDNNDAISKIYVEGLLEELKEQTDTDISQQFNDLKLYTDTQLDNLKATFDEDILEVYSSIEDNIVDNLTTSQIDKSLSANQGVMINSRLSYIENIISNLGNNTDNIKLFKYDDTATDEDKQIFWQNIVDLAQIEDIYVMLDMDWIICLSDTVRIANGSDTTLTFYHQKPIFTTTVQELTIRIDTSCFYITINNKIVKNTPYIKLLETVIYDVKSDELRIIEHD